jgi:transposase
MTERYLRIATDYKSGYKIKEIMERNGIKSVQTVYNAINFLNKKFQEELNDQGNS